MNLHLVAVLSSNAVALLQVALCYANSLLGFFDLVAPSGLSDAVRAGCIKKKRIIDRI